MAIYRYQRECTCVNETTKILVISILMLCFSFVIRLLDSSVTLILLCLFIDCIDSLYVICFEPKWIKTVTPSYEQGPRNHHDQKWCMHILGWWGAILWVLDKTVEFWANSTIEFCLAIHNVCTSGLHTHVITLIPTHSESTTPLPYQCDN